MRNQRAGDIFNRQQFGSDGGITSQKQTERGLEAERSILNKMKRNKILHIKESF